MNRQLQIFFKNAKDKNHRADDCANFNSEYTTYDEKINCIKVLKNADKTELELYFYHSDHIGSSSFITDADGYASQHLQYLPFGELFVEQRASVNYYTPYKFSGKEKDEETSYSYFGARYYMSDVSVWLSVDPMRDKIPSFSPYVYCLNNPVLLKDPDGNFPISVHIELLKNAFSATNSTAPTKMLYGTGIKADIVHSSNNSVHLDNQNSAGAIGGYNKAGANFESAMSSGNLVDAGESLHTVADFYSHSNYIDIYMDYADKAGITLDANNIPTLDEAMAIPDLKNMLDKNLKTGNFKNLISDKLSNKEEDHKNFSLDENKGKGAQPFSGNVTKSEAAKNVAQKDISNRVANYQQSKKESTE